MKYAVCDIETTGGNNRTGKIIEIAVFLVENDEIIDEFQSLINPERPIPPFITSMTGISAEMVADAPRFYEIAKRLVEITSDAIFVAHNVSFDYNYIVTEFARLGYTFQREKMCTLALSRKLLPGHEKYSLGNLCNDLGISLNDRHRAAGDARATVDLLLLLLQKGIFNKGRTFNVSPSIHPKLDINRFASIPETTGVYYFYDENGNLIYIGKSTNLHRRVLEHFYNRKSPRDIRMQELCTDIDYVETGSELVALLKESHEIKYYKPLLNRAGRRTMARFGIFESSLPDGYITFTIEAISSKQKQTALRSFDSREMASAYLDKMIRRYELCQKLCGRYTSEGPCFDHQIRKCRGACCGKETSSDYNQRALQAANELKMADRHFIITEGRKLNGHFPFVLVENGQYSGFGYVPDDEQIIEASHCYPFLEKKLIADKDANGIIQSFMRKGKFRLIKL